MTNQNLVQRTHPFAEEPKQKRSLKKILGRSIGAILIAGITVTPGVFMMVKNKVEQDIKRDVDGLYSGFNQLGKNFMEAGHDVIYKITNEPKKYGIKVEIGQKYKSENEEDSN